MPDLPFQPDNHQISTYVPYVCADNLPCTPRSIFRPETTCPFTEDKKTKTGNPNPGIRSGLHYPPPNAIQQSFFLSPRAAHQIKLPDQILRVVQCILLPKPNYQPHHSKTYLSQSLNKIQDSIHSPIAWVSTYVVSLFLCPVSLSYPTSPHRHGTHTHQVLLLLLTTRAEAGPGRPGDQWCGLGLHGWSILLVSTIITTCTYCRQVGRQYYIIVWDYTWGNGLAGMWMRMWMWGVGDWGFTWEVRVGWGGLS